ncbi:MAG: M14 family zinc carboxypeptidase [Thermoanaerobaculia bacterium]
MGSAVAASTSTSTGSAPRRSRRSRLPGRWHRVDEAILGFECYRSVEEMLARGAEIAAQYPDLAEWIDLGDSWEKIHPGHGGPGYDIEVLRLTNRTIGGHKPALLVTGSTHAREYTTPELVTRFAELLVSRYGIDPDVTWLLDHHRIDLVLIQNPDGRKRAETGLLWRKNADDDACTGSNSRGIDLNRNFDFMWGGAVCSGSSSSQCSETYHGASAASEPETQAVQAHMTAVFPDQRPDDFTTPAPRDSEGIYLDIHSFGGDVLSSWGCVGTIGPMPGTNGDDICALGRKYGSFTGYPARIGSTSPVDGSSKDFTYGRLGVPGYTIETGTAFFEECPTFETVILEPNLAALLQTAKNVRTSYMTAWGPDTLGLSVPALPVAVGDPVSVTGTVDDTRYGPAVGLCTSAPSPIETVAAAELYVDTPPWSGGSPIALAASDGTFDETAEDVETTLATGSLAPGRHILFARGRDAHDDLGAVSAAFLHVYDPSSSPVLDGVIRDHETGGGVAATVTIGPFQVAADGTGTYGLQLPPGTYDVSATAPGYAPAAVTTVQLDELEVRTLDMTLFPLEVVLADDVESGAAGWTAQAPWAITTEAANSPTHPGPTAPAATTRPTPTPP